MPRMIAGADGCPTGWLCIVDPDGSGDLRSFIAPDLQALLGRLAPDAILAIDIPIGLPDRGARRCDLEARRMLGPRASSVFPAPIRPVLAATSYEHACEVREAAEGKRMSKQAFAIIPKIREVDIVLSSAGGRCEVRECHPEVSFANWSGAPLRHPKKRAEGRDERAALIDHAWPGQRETLKYSLPRGVFATDDLHDAFAALWTADRIRRGAAVVLPRDPDRDSLGLAMEIVA